MDKATQQAVVHAWRVARASEDIVVRGRVQDLKDRMSAAPSSEVGQQAIAANRQKKRKVEMAGPGGARTWKRVQYQPPAETSEKMEELLQFWHDLYEDAGITGTRWLPQEAGSEEARKEIVGRKWAQTDVKRLSALRTAWRRWERWCAKAARDPVRNVSPLSVGCFLREVSQGGPTAARQVAWDLRWIMDLSLIHI